MRKNFTPRALLASMACLAATLHSGAQTGTATYERKTDIPTLYVETETGQDAGKTDYVKCRVVLVDEAGKQTVYDLTKKGIRGRGNSTWSLDGTNLNKKLPWRLKFDSKEKLLGKDFANAKDWTLLANAFDKSLMRNALTYHLGKACGLAFCPSYKFVDLVMNGDYRGTYQLSDQMEVRKKRVQVGDNDSTVWLLEYANSNTKVDDPKIELTRAGWGGVNGRGAVEIKNPEFDNDDLASDPDMAERIRQFLNDQLGPALTKRLSNWSSTSTTDKYEYVDPRTGYRSIIDEPSLVAWYIATEVTANWDGLYSIYMYRDPEAGAPLYFGPMWDYDLAYGNHTETYQYFSNNSYYNNLLCDNNFPSSWETSNPNGYRKMQPVIKHLWDDPWFSNAVATRFDELVADGLADKLTAAVDAMQAQLAQSAAMNYQRWSISSDDPGYSIAAERSSWNAAVQNLRNFVGTRVSKLQTLFTSKNSGVVYLDEAADNTPALSAALGSSGSAVVARTVLARTATAGTWNTVCLPFKVSANRIKYLFGEGTVVQAFTGVTRGADGEVYLDFTPVATMEAGKPYLVRPALDVDRAFPFFEMGFSSPTPQTVTHDGYAFSGTYAPTQLAADGSQLFVASGNRLLRPSAGSKPLKGFRAYFTLPADAAASVRMRIADAATAIGTAPVERARGDGRVYTLSGQCVGTSLDGLPHGIYIVNGKKVVK